jgi:hypothetical protein
VLDGAGRLDGPTPTAFVKGDVILLPAGMTGIETRTDSATTYLEVTVPHEGGSTARSDD